MTLKWIFERNKKQLGKVVGLSLVGVCNALLGIGFALISKRIVDAAVVQDEQAFITYGIATLTIVVGMLIFRFVSGYLEELARTCAENDLREYMLNIIITRDYNTISKYHTGELLNRLFSDITLVGNSYVSIIPCLVAMLVRLLGIAAVMLVLDWRFSLVFFVGGVVIVCINVMVRRRMKEYHVKMQESSGRVRAFAQEVLGSIMVVRAFDAGQNVQDESNRKMQDYKNIRMKKNVFSNIAGTGFGAFMNLGRLFGLVWCGYGIMKGDITYGTLLAVTQLIGQLQLPINNISAIVPQYYSMTASAGRLMELCDIDNCHTQESTVECRDFEGITGRDITMSYGPDEENIIEHADINIAKGDFVAITGTSGIGKSTLIKILMGIYPLEEGSLNVRLGRDTYSLNHTRGVFAYVPQGNMLLSGTVKDMITLYSRDCDMERIENACKIACAHRFVSQLKEGYDTVLGERGQGISEGQMQRLAIARAIYHDAPVLLLDEATSALDEETELNVLKNIKSLTGKTVIIITHRPRALEFCNRRITIRDKKIIEEDR